MCRAIEESIWRPDPLPPSLANSQEILKNVIIQERYGLQCSTWAQNDRHSIVYNFCEDSFRVGTLPKLLHRGGRHLFRILICPAFAKLKTNKKTSIRIQNAMHVKCKFSLNMAQHVEIKA